MYMGKALLIFDMITFPLVVFSPIFMFPWLLWCTPEDLFSFQAMSFYSKMMNLHGRESELLSGGKEE